MYTMTLLLPLLKDGTVAVHCGLISTSRWQAGIYVYNDSVIALTSGTGGQLYGCVLIVGTGRPGACIMPRLST